MENQETEPTAEKRAVEILSLLSGRLPTHESILKGESLPEWLLQPWASRLGDLDDPELPQTISEADEWLKNH